MTISKEYLLDQLERAVESRLDALKTFHMRDGAVQMLSLLLDKAEELEPTLSSTPDSVVEFPKPPSRKFPKISP